jgi:hypothetical protein
VSYGRPNWQGTPCERRWFYHYTKERNVDELNTKVTTIAERCLDRFWPGWRTTSDVNSPTVLAVKEAAAEAFGAGLRSAASTDRAMVEAEVLKRINAVTDHFARERAATSQDVEMAVHAERAAIVNALRAIGDKLAQKHGELSMLALVLRLAELEIVRTRIAGLRR